MPLGPSAAPPLALGVWLVALCLHVGVEDVFMERKEDRPRSDR